MTAVLSKLRVEETDSITKWSDLLMVLHKMVHPPKKNTLVPSQFSSAKAAVLFLTFFLLHLGQFHHFPELVTFTPDSQYPHCCVYFFGLFFLEAGAYMKVTLILLYSPHISHS